MADAELEELTLEECLERLRAGSVGRIGIVVDDFPIVVPVNYRLVESAGPPWVAVRTRIGGVIHRGELPCAFEIDDIDPARQEGWSVLVRGTLHAADSDAADFRERFDPEPWITEDRDAWLVVASFSVTGRRLHREAREWTYEPTLYL
jgi:nitroimidazol reductase NimA-like FMN-containing flavoprotein (pyridoxamine 5'-phosphate oxidase superfamily)